MANITPKKNRWYGMHVFRWLEMNAACFF